MRQIRNGVFETNSSSTHSIAIPKQQISKRRPSAMHFGIGEFGWAHEEADPADYLYTAILAQKPDKRRELLQQLKEVLESNNITYTMQAPKFWRSEGVEGDFLDNGYIDHSEDLGEFLTAVFQTPETLLNFIFEGLVFTGNDNCDDEGFTYRFRPEITEWDPKTHEEFTVPNPYYIPRYEKYDWYVKGN